jgi:hypothetical protein
MKDQRRSFQVDRAIKFNPKKRARPTLILSQQQQQQQLINSSLIGCVSRAKGKRRKMS